MAESSNQGKRKKEVEKVLWWRQERGKELFMKLSEYRCVIIL